MNEITHRGRSNDFLSRLHDGEVPDVERRSFENHCATCPDCRAAVEDYERSLSLYRQASVAPTPTDLSGRILRKVRAQSPSRRPFGVTFGIDIRWAGALVAALLVILASAPLLLRRELPTSEPPAPPPIPAHLLDRPSPASDGNVPSQTGLRSNAGSPAETGRAQPVPGHTVGDRPRPSAEEPPRLRPAPPAQSVVNAPKAALSKDEVAAAPMRSQEAPSKLAAPFDSEAAPASEEKSQAILEAPAVRLVVRALDGQGPLPAILARPPDERLAPLRGREFIVTVEPTGAVSDVSPVGAAPRSAARQVEAGKAAKAPDDGALREFRFAAGARVLRLLVRID
jgi:hypothetical protein